MPYLVFARIHFVVLLLLLFAALAHAPVEVRVSPRTIMVGGAVNVTCRVEPNADNRGLAMGIEGYRASTIDLDGASAAVTRSMPFEHIPCDAGDAFCALQTIRGNKQAATPIAVGGCDSQ